MRHNSTSALPTRNRVEIQQDAAAFYPRMMKDIATARHSIHLQYLYDKDYLHAKTISIELGERLGRVGEHRSFSINYELNAVLYSERTARQ
ncbi:MAG TPA: hypothetical protein VHF87_20695 [Methylomirabilota bacterium]|nr:hypothetical protein [Methylomirabilota bacterium]